MARKAEPNRTLNVSVVGLSGTEKDKGQVGVGKSCICNRFIKPLADDYHVEHISVLSQSDFSGRVVNNDHFLYWGETTKTADDGAEYHFHVIEQTEFIDDASFQPFKGGKMEPYVKRCAATKLSSAEKLMYICKNQLGIEKEYEQKVMPDKVNIDGFICVFDVSMVPSRPIERQVDFLAAVLTNLLKAKKPVVLATTKNDEAFDGFVREAEKLISRKEFKGNVVMVETSSHENVNVDLAFLVLAQIIDKSKNRMRVVPFAEAARVRKDILDIATEAFQRLIRAQVTDFRALWTPTMKKLNANQDYIHYTELFGVDSAQKLFRRHVKKLKDEHLGRKIKGYMDMLPQILMQFFPDLPSLGNGDWECIKDKLHDHPDFNLYFLDCPPDMSWAETDLLETTDNRIPFDVLDTGEAELVFRNHVNTLQQEEKIEELRKAFKQLLEETGYVTPGKALSEVQVLFMGRECFEALSESDCQQIYDQHQREISEKARRNFQELLLEHAHLFYQFKTIAPSGTVTQDDIREITEELQEDSRYKALDRLDQERRLLLLQHLGFVHCPRRENCPAYPACMDIIVERLISSKARRPSSWNRNSQWLLSGDSNQLNLVLLGVCGLASQLASEIRALCEDDEYELENQLYSLDYRIIEGDVNQPQNSFRTADFTPQGCFCVYSNEESFEYIRDSLEKTLLSNLEQEDRLPFQGLPIVILMAADPSLTETQISSLRNEGLSLADNLQCPFIEVSSQSTESNEANQFSSSLISSALRALVLTIQQRAGLLSVCQSSVVESCEPDIRIVMCVLCGDPYSVESVLAPLLTHQCCFLSGENSLTVETFLGDCKRRVEVVVTSYHGADSFRDDLVHGFILVYSTKRKASLATLTAFSQNIPNLPIQVLAVTDIGGTAGAFFSSELSHQLLTAGNAVADRLQSHFMTLTLSGNQKTGIYTPFFKDVWDKKVEIEQAYHMEDSAALDDSGEGTLERPMNRAHPLPPPRHESYRIRAGSNEGSGSEIYEKLPTDGSLGDELDDPVSPTFPDDRRLTPSDDSDIYSTLDRPGSGSNPPHQSQQQQTRKENGEHLVKPSQLKNRHEVFRQSYPSVESLPNSFSLSLRGPFFTRSGGPSSHIFTLQSHSPAASGLNPSSSGVNPYSTPSLPPFQSPPPFQLGSSDSQDPNKRDPTYGAGPYATRAGLRYSTFRQQQQQQQPSGLVSPAQGSAPSARLSMFQPPPTSLVQAEAALWGDRWDRERDAAQAQGDKLSRGGFQVFPPPSTPPEPAPSDRAPNVSTQGRWQLLASSSLPTASSHTSLDEAPCWLDDSVFIRRNETQEDTWTSNPADTYAHRAFTTGRRRFPGTQQLPAVPPGTHTSHTARQQQQQQPPGKLNLKDYANVTDAISRMKVSSKELAASGGGGGVAPPLPPPRLAKVGGSHTTTRAPLLKSGLLLSSIAPLATPENEDLELQLSPGTPQMKESHAQRGHFGSYDGEYNYTPDLVLPATSTSKSRTARYRREKGKPANYTDSDSDWSSPERRGGAQGLDPASRSQRKSSSHKRPRRKRTAIPVATPRVPPLPASFSQAPPPGIPLPLSSRITGTIDKAKLRDPIYLTHPDDESSLDVSSPREKDTGSPMMGFMNRQREKDSAPAGDRDQSIQRRRDKAKAKEDEKLEKRRQKEEERQRREKEKEKERERKRKTKGSNNTKSAPAPTLEDIVQAEGRSVPLFLEKCVAFIEEEGLDSEGIYRVPGNRAHVDILFQKFDEDPNVNIRDLDIAVNAVATALKDFFSKRLPPVLTPEQMDELEEISMTADRSIRLLNLRGLLRKLSTARFDVLKFIFHHFVRIAENCKANSMDSKNLAICWWPTLLPFEFTDMGRFESMRPHLEDTVQAMIDQFPFLFLGKDEVVMV